MGMVLSIVLPDCTCDGSYKKESFPTVNVVAHPSLCDSVDRVAER